jgi:hypothetical protein
VGRPSSVIVAGYYGKPRITFTYNSPNVGFATHPTSTITEVVYCSGLKPLSFEAT